MPFNPCFVRTRRVYLPVLALLLPAMQAPDILIVGGGIASRNSDCGQNS